jgi:hypothetical protein
VLVTRRQRAALLVAIGAGSWIASPRRAQALGSGPADFLSISVGGRPAALGGAYTALSEDAYAPVWNPAGLGHLAHTQAAGMHLEYLDSIGYEFGAAALPLTASDGLGFSIQYLHPKSDVARDATGADNGSLSSHFAAYTMAYGHGFTGGLSLGAAIKEVQASLGGVSANAVAADLGARYRLNPQISLGASAVNLGGKMTFIQDSQSLPNAYHLGAAYAPVHGVNLAAETVYDGPSASTSLRLGAEWSPAPLLALRLGYRSDGAAGGTLGGFATGVGLTALGQAFDYAWEPQGQLGDTHYFSMLFTFGGAQP